MNQGTPVAFSFDEEFHRYSVAGREVPSVTHVLASSGLVSFAFVGQDILERKSELGREVHKACHLYNQGKGFRCDDQVRPYLESWIRFRMQTKLTIVLSEHQQIASVNGIDYGMRVDVEAELAGQDTIIDIKTGQVRPDHAIQLAGYAAGLYHARLETPMGRFRTRKRIAVQLQEDRNLAKIHRFEDKSDFEVFAACLFANDWKRKNSKFYRETDQ